MNAISGTRRAIKELVDGTIRVQIDVDPQHRKAFFALFPEIDSPVALAPLKPEATSNVIPIRDSPPEHAPKGGDLSKLAGMLCADTGFQKWISESCPDFAWPTVTEEAGIEGNQEELAAVMVRNWCKVKSRAELDHNPAAAKVFHEEIRKPWLERAR